MISVVVKVVDDNCRKLSADEEKLYREWKKWKNRSKWHPQPSRAPTPRIKFNYDYCILRGKGSCAGGLVKHHIFPFKKDSDHNSVRNVVLLCAKHHKYFAHSGHWGYSIASRTGMDFFWTREYDCSNMLACVLNAEVLWLRNPYNFVDGEFYSLPKCYSELRLLYESKLAKCKY